MSDFRQWHRLFGVSLIDLFHGQPAVVAVGRDPISAARAVMEMEGARPVLLAGAGSEDVVLAEDARKRYSIDKVSDVYFRTPLGVGREPRTLVVHPHDCPLFERRPPCR